MDYRDVLIDKAGLLWLSPTFSTGISYPSILEKLRLGSDSDFSGLRFATWREVDSLAYAYGGIGPDATQTIASQSEIDAFLVDFECDPSFLIDGYIGVPADGGEELSLDGNIENPKFSSCGEEISYLRDTWPMSQDNGATYFPSWEERGWWLVALPEPPTLHPL